MIGPAEANTLAAAERASIYAAMDEWAIGRPPAELNLLPRMLALQLQGMVQPGGLTETQVAELQRATHAARPARSRPDKCRARWLSG